MSSVDCKELVPGGPTKYYARTARGRKQLQSETEEWGRQIAAIGRILEAS
jgi:DNA-binding PadR family transcriptional regulator